MSKRVSISLMVGAICMAIAPLASAGLHCGCHVRHHHHCCPQPTCGCAPAPTCGCGHAAPSCGCGGATIAPSCGAPGVTPTPAPNMAPAPTPAPMPPAPAPAPGKAAEYSPMTPTQAWRSNETSRSEGQIGSSSSINSNENGFTTIQKRTDDNSTGSNTGSESNGSTGSSGNTSGN